ncbi:MAG: toxin C-terminal domain-containing protein [Gallionella sp.]|nr:toxin C-terminal domain-containing protein [Gallionella sp.]
MVSRVLARHERTVEYQADGSTVHVLSPRYDTGLHFEKRVKADGSIEYEHYLYAGGLMFGKYVTHTNALGAAIQSTDMAGTPRSRVIEYYLKDQLGSITAQVNGDPNPALLPSGTANPDAGKYAVRSLSYDVWGKKRFADGVPDTTGALNNPDMYHGFTGHEMLDEVGLIHMNGRLYDPVTGRFVSADFLIEAPGNLQSYNRYSYVWNNPLSNTDASGQCFICVVAIVSAVVGRATGVIDTQTARGIIGIAAGVWLGGAGGLLNGSFGGAVATGGIVGGISSGWEGVGPGMLSAGLFYGAGSFAGTMGGAELAETGTGPWVHGGIGRVMAHAAAGCAGAMASGGSCGRGAMTAGVSEGVGGNLGKYDGVVARAVLGGTVSVIGGGKFSNGAVTGAYSYIFNYCAHATGKCTTAFEQAMYDYWPAYKYGTCLSNGGCTASELAGTSADMAIGIVGGVEGKGGRLLAESVFKTTKAAMAAAEELGFSRINDTVHGGQAVFKRGSDFITRDLDGHNGGAWKMADSVKALGSKNTRSGTYDRSLNRIGD